MKITECTDTKNLYTLCFATNYKLYFHLLEVGQTRRMPKQVVCKSCGTDLGCRFLRLPMPLFRKVVMTISKLTLGETQELFTLTFISPAESNHNSELLTWKARGTRQG